MHEVKHPIWGSNLANQLSATEVYDKGEDGNGYRTEKVVGWFGRKKLEKVHVGNKKVPATDADTTWRCFSHRCGLLRIVMTSGGRKGPLFVTFLDGHVASNFDASDMEFRFAPEELDKNGGKPIVDISFGGTGTRWGLLRDYYPYRVAYTFADKNQMDEYLDVTNRRMPKAITHKGVTYSSTGSGTYQSSDGSILPYLLVLYLLLSSNEQQAFAAQNPEVQDFLGGGGESGGAGASGTFDSGNAADQGSQAPADGVVYDDGGQSGGTDSGPGDSGSSSSDSGSSFSSDSGSSFSSDSGSSSSSSF